MSLERETEWSKREARILARLHLIILGALLILIISTPFLVAKGFSVFDEELKELVRQVVQEKVERLVEEMFPKMAAEAIERELALWKKRLTD